MTLTISRSIEISQKPAKSGRNDPCYCGSGKKYKKCHLLKEQVYNPDEKSNYLTKLLDWAMDKPWFKDIFAREIDQVFGRGAQVEENEVDSLLEALLFEAHIESKTPLELFVEQADLSEADRKYYQHWIDESIFSTFEVKKVSIGSSLEIQDFHGGKIYLVYEKLATYSLQEGMSIMTRIIPYREQWVFTGANLGAFPKEALYMLQREISSHSMPRLPQLEYVRHEFGKAQKIEETIRAMNFSMLKLRLKKEFEKRNIAIDVDELDSKIEKKESIKLESLIKQIAKKCTAEKDLNFLTELLYEMHHKHPIFQKLKEEPGPKEKMLISQMMHEAKLQFLDKVPAEKINQLLKGFSNRWFDTKQKELGDMTPREIILEERRERGHPYKEISYSLNVSRIPLPHQQENMFDQYDKAVRLMQRKQNYLEALRLLSTYTPSSLPDPFRWYNNVGICLINLGEMELAKLYFQKALDKNPSYDLPRTNLKNYDSQDTYDSMKKRGRQILFASVITDNIDLSCKEIADSEIVKDAYVFFHYLTKDTITLTPKRKFIPFRQVKQINREFVHPDPLYAIDDKDFPYREEWQMPKVNFLTVVSLTAGILKEDGNTLRLTKKGEKIVRSPPQQLWNTLFSTWLVKVGWEHVGERPSTIGRLSGRFNSIFQDRTFELFGILFRLGESFTLSDLVEKISSPKKNLQDTSMYYEVVLEKSFFCFLEWFGLIQTQHRGKMLSIFGIKSPKTIYKVTSLGKCVVGEIKESMHEAIPVNIPLL